MPLRPVPLLLALAALTAAEPGRERLLMDPGWRFAVGSPAADGGVAVPMGLSVDPGQSFGAFAKAGGVGGPADTGFDDLTWRRVDLPHDWAVEMPFSEKADAAHGFKTVGPQFPSSSVGWYRRTFTIPASDAGRRIRVEFDGVFRDAEFMINGHYLGRNFSGYAPVTYDLTPYLNVGGANTLAVKVDATSFEGWFYEGAGIYRHVWLVKSAPVHIPAWGTWATSVVEGDPKAPTATTVTARATVRNDGDQAARLTVQARLLDAEGQEVAAAASSPITLDAGAETETAVDLRVATPRLWGVDTPYLYRVETRILLDGQEVDRVTTNHGIRTIAWDANQGFFLNGVRTFLKGTCNHQDHAGIGVALPDRVNEWRIQRLKDMGCNAYRASHNPPTPELLDACDRLGMLVMDETRTVGATDEALSQLERLIRRDRHHPSVVIWSLGNEEMSIQKNDIGVAILKPMQRLAKALDPTRPTTIAMNGYWGQGFSKVVDVQGSNYLKLGGGYDAFHKNHPQQPVVGSEEASHTTTRGVYVQADDRFYSHADETKARFPGWASSSEAWLNHYAERPFVAGGFAWTGFDYRGEPTPFHRWPSINSHFGILDTCGFPKDVYYVYQARWTDRPVLHLLPHWTWPGQEGKPMEVRCDTNAEEVELFLNGASQGRKATPKGSHLRWTVPYAPGTLEAVGYAAGKEVSRTRVETTGAPAAVRLTTERTTLGADGEDVAMVTVAVVDAQGRTVPDAGDRVSFGLTGPGRILGVGNGDPTCHEPDVYLPEPPKALTTAWNLALGSDGAASEARFGEKILEKDQVGIWRGQVTLTAAQTTQALELSPVVSRGTATVTWNGTTVTLTPPVTRLPAGVAGTNTLEVRVTSDGRFGGLKQAPRIVAIAPPADLPWSRSVFHGLAQVIVQTRRAEPGTLTLTATGTGLTAGTLALTASPVTPRPTVP